LIGGVKFLCRLLNSERAVERRRRETALAVSVSYESGTALTVVKGLKCRLSVRTNASSFEDSKKVGSEAAIL